MDLESLVDAAEEENGMNGSVYSSEGIVNGIIAAPLDRASLLSLIRQQVEFYFSEENLPKDVFLLKQIEKDKTKEGFVSLKVIAGFPKMKRLTHDLGAIREAVEQSELVVLSVDGLSLKRKIPLILPEDTTEKRTLYVTRLPKDCDRESLMLVFSEFGTVVRLDLPMDKKTGEHKGMAFVEYRVEEELHKALEEFTTSDKYKMLAKPFKSKNNKEKDNAKVLETNTASTESEDSSDSTSPKDGKEKRASGGKKPNKRSSKEEVKRNSKEEKQDTKRNSGKLDKEWRNSKEETKEWRNSKEENKEKRNSIETNKDKRNSKETKTENKRSSKGDNKDKRTSKEFQTRDLPDPSYDFGRVRANSRGKKSEMPLDWDSASIRPKLHLMEDRPLISPVRNPFGPTDGRGFTAGRGKLVK